MVTTLPWISASPAQEGEISRRQIGNGPVLGWQYVGCYSDSDSARTLSVSRDVGSQMTPLLCTTFCQGGLLDVTGINFAGTEFSDECYCDFNLQGTAIKLNDNECSYPCAGDSTYTCGGASRISVYQNMLLQGNLPKNKATVAGGWKFEGCHTDSLNTPPGRTLSQRVSTPTGQVTIESCTAQCGALGFSIAGLEYGQECCE
ncbi:hypothetical protein M413DRAFT_30383 [Hebeloma cylindrosporum]|uniref:WSC domain-containing protein n=1 Tax=Hebeloma cylindrosporum TaxID=76867 RepID=A0A0C3C1X1_HEBCY|nr:hypothetical protein M413DRAFT_30383 [Hebeloma cylindrosporum h7]